ncbi:Putative major facilitator, sugar transporter, major facilitator superfamily [Colletotrichum destructivum]|uniref:Major facilitator, sugar transporter, major facilitator superfamily n=1 Tax=Colletotrichum destructivum TaxID=34406 RepID=A0AAX4IL28_9PEZI|nr:Putative major facilitator, sugar transporter, major facilitator superfamily [Colletotrichum destructivum]
MTLPTSYITQTILPGFLIRAPRKGGIFISSALVLVSCILLSTSTTRAQFFVGHVLVGIAKTIDIASVPTYLVELTPPSRRGFVGGLYWACWLLGAIISSAVGYGVRSVAGEWSWRLICICMAGPALACIALLPFIPESPRWLISKGQGSKGLKVLTEYHGNGDATHPMVTAQFREINETIAFEKESQFESYAAWWKAFAQSKSNRHCSFILLTLGIFEQTVGSSIITFYLSQVLNLAGITSEREQFAINLGQNCVAFVSALTGICLIDKLGRVPMLTVGTAFCAAVLACMAGLTADQTDSAAGRNGIIAMVFLFYCIFTPSSGFFNQYVIPIGLAGIGWRFYIVGVAWNILAAFVIYFTYMETKGLILEQIDKRFNGIPRDQLDDVIEAYYGGKPISEGELDLKSEVKVVP